MRKILISTALVAGLAAVGATQASAQYYGGPGYGYNNVPWGGNNGWTPWGGNNGWGGNNWTPWGGNNGWGGNNNWGPFNGSNSGNGTGNFTFGFNGSAEGQGQGQGQAEGQGQGYNNMGNSLGIFMGPNGQPMMMGPNGPYPIMITPMEAPTEAPAAPASE